MSNLITMKNVSMTFKDQKRFKIKNLFKTSKERIVFKDLNLEIDSDSSYLLIGDNGTGKSTLIRLVAGILSPTSGHISVAKNTLCCLSRDIVFYSRLTIFENMKFCSLVLLHRSLDEKFAQEVLNFSEVSMKLDTISNGLSTGMSARIFISLALFSGASNIIFDETFSNVQYDFVQKALNYAKEKKVNLIITTHSPSIFKDYDFNTIDMKSLS